MESGCFSCQNINILLICVSFRLLAQWVYTKTIIIIKRYEGRARVEKGQHILLGVGCHMSDIKMMSWLLLFLLSSFTWLHEDEKKCTYRNVSPCLCSVDAGDD